MVLFGSTHYLLTALKHDVLKMRRIVYYIPQNVAKYILSNIHFYLNVVNVDSGI